MIDSLIPTPPGGKQAGIARRCVELIADGSPVLIFTDFPPSAERLQRVFEKQGILSSLFTPIQSQEELEERAHAFQGIPCAAHQDGGGGLVSCVQTVFSRALMP